MTNAEHLLSACRAALLTVRAGHKIGSPRFMEAFDTAGRKIHPEARREPHIAPVIKRLRSAFIWSYSDGEPLPPVTVQNALRYLLPLFGMELVKAAAMADATAELFAEAQGLTKRKAPIGGSAKVVPFPTVHRVGIIRRLADQMESVTPKGAENILRARLDRLAETLAVRDMDPAVIAAEVHAMEAAVRMELALRRGRSGNGGAA
jgi:hypothetical protein